MTDSFRSAANPASVDRASDVRYVGFWARVLATIVDTVLLVAVTTPITYLAFGRNDLVLDLSATAPSTNPADLVISVALPAMIVIVFWIRRQATPGKLLLSARIVDARTGAEPTPRQCALRYVGYYLSGLVLGLGFLWVAFDRRKQGWHDKLADTVVIRVDDRAPEAGRRLV